MPCALALTVEDGEFFDGHKLTVGSEVRWRPSKHFEMGAAYTVDDVELPQRERNREHGSEPHHDELEGVGVHDRDHPAACRVFRSEPR